jgi:cytochrome c oxidase subunit 2
MFGSQVPLEGGTTVTADENYVRESILYPNAKIHAGYQPVMPSYLGQLKDNDISAIIAYMKSISVNFKGDISALKSVAPAQPPTTAPVQQHQ